MSDREVRAEGAHPAWCSPEHCYRVEEGDRVHVQAPLCWETDDELVPTRFETGLLGPEDQPGITYLELGMRSPVAGATGILSLAEVRRLRDQLTAHLDAAESGRRNRLVGVQGRLVTTSGQAAHTDAAAGVGRG